MENASRILIGLYCIPIEDTPNFKTQIIELTEFENQMVKDADSFSSDGSDISVEGQEDGLMSDIAFVKEEDLIALGLKDPELEMPKKPFLLYPDMIFSSFW